MTPDDWKILIAGVVALVGTSGIGSAIGACMGARWQAAKARAETNNNEAQAERNRLESDGQLLANNRGRLALIDDLMTRLDVVDGKLMKSDQTNREAQMREGAMRAKISDLEAQNAAQAEEIGRLTHELDVTNARVKGCEDRWDTIIAAAQSAAINLSQEGVPHESGA